MNFVFDALDLAILNNDIYIIRIIHDFIERMITRLESFAKPT